MRIRRQQLAVVAAAAAIALGLPVGLGSVASAQGPTGDVELASIDSGEGGGRELPGISADGDRVVFVGRGETNQGLWVRDRSAGQTTRVATGSVFNPAISADGNTATYVVYGASRQVYVRDITDPASPGPAMLVSKATNGTVGDGLSDFPTVSGNGRYVAFQSTSANLDPSVTLPTGGPNKVYLHDRDVSGDGTLDQPGDISTTLISEAVDGSVPAGNATKPDITPDGTHVAFVSEQPLVASAAAAAAEEEETATATQIWKVSVAAGDVTAVDLVSHAPDGAYGDLGSGLVNAPSISDDASVVAFESDATNLVVGDVNGDTDAFIDDDGTVTRVSVNGRPGMVGDEFDLETQLLNPCNGDPWLDEEGAPIVPAPVVGANAQVSGDGSFVVFQSQAALTVDDLNDTVVRDGTVRINDVYGFDVASGEVERISQPLPVGLEATGCRPEGRTGILGPMTDGGDPAIGATRTYVAFGSNGDLAAERPVAVEPEAAAAAEEEEGTSTEAAIHVRTYGALGVGAFVRDTFALEGAAGESLVPVLVGLTAPAAGPTSVEVTTADLTATAGDDYQSTTATVEFAAGEISKVVEVPVIGDIAMEDDETFSVTITSADVPIGAGVAVVTIGDDDHVASFNEHYSSLPFNVTGDYIPLVGDFDGNGTSSTPDVLWYAPGPAADYLWFVTGTDGSLVKDQESVTITGTYQPMVFDFDADGLDDVFWYAPGPAADFVWFSTGSGFESVPVSVSGQYRPVATYAAGQPAVFWHAPGSATDYLWIGNTDRTFSRVGAPQVSGTYQPVAIEGPDGQPGILWYGTGTAPDSVWSGLAAGPALPDTIRAVSINGTYQPVSQYPAVLLYGPGTAPDFMVGFDLFGSGFASLQGTVNGVYSVGASPTVGTVDWHAPGSATDYLWTVGG